MIFTPQLAPEYFPDHNKTDFSTKKTDFYAAGFSVVKIIFCTSLFR